jgi:2-(1,2-epoxy-1,2-dihydrophenyl)acetyl-CoA isomerase
MEVSRLLHEIAKPTIAMVNGPAASAGMALALACDLRIAAQSSQSTFLPCSIQNCDVDHSALVGDVP